MKYFSSGAMGFAALIGLYLSVIKNKRQISMETVESSINEELNKLKTKVYYDATAPLLPETTVYPGDPTLSVKSVCKVGESSCFGLSEISLSNHMGTHIDFPAHVIKGGNTSSDYTLNDLSGKGIIIEIPSELSSITRDHVKVKGIYRDSIVFFKTKNSSIPKTGSFKKDYVYIEPDAAEILVQLGVKIIGIDYISVDSIENEDLPSHNTFLKNGVLIVENLELNGISPGECEVQIAPLNIPNMDGLPSRVILSK